MTKIRNIFNNGKRFGAKLGVVNVGHNICPDTITADATPAVLTVAQMNQYNYFNVTRDTADTDEFDLPDAAEVGYSMTLNCVTGFEIRTETDSDLINAVTNTGYTTTTNDIVYCTKVAATKWVMWKLAAADGAVTSIVPGVAP
jgi:hypothetical protein